MGEAGDANEVGKGPWLRLEKGSPSCLRSEFRQTESPRFLLEDVVLQMQGIGRPEKGEGFRIVDLDLSVDLLERDAAIVAHHLDRLRIDMSEHVELQDVVVDGMEIVMGRLPGRIDFVGGILDGSEVIDFHLIRMTMTPPWVLSCRPFDIHAALGDAVDLGVPDPAGILAQGFRNIRGHSLWRSSPSSSGSFLP